MKKLRENISFIFDTVLFKYSSLIIAIIVLLCSINVGRYNGNYINSDGKGYYAYLPAIFIYQDLDYNFIDEYESKYYASESYFDHFISYFDGEVANMGFVGTSILMLPFFIAAHLGSFILGLPTDGYAPLYQYSIGFAAVFYLFLALWGIKKLLEIYRVKPFHIALVQTLIVFATPVYYYATVEASFTHIYTFAVITLFLFSVKSYIQNHKPRFLYLSSFILGLIMLIRPSNMIIVVALPFLAGDWSKLKELFIHIFTEYKQLLIGIIILLLVVSIQPIMYYIQVGRFFIWTYQGVGFNFMDPYFYSILFSYKKGLFVYTPVLIFSVLGFLYLFKTNKFQAWSLLLILVLMNYILSSWWNWWYGMSYGNRAFIDYFVFFALLLGFALKENKIKIVRYIIYFITPLVIIVNLIQTYQYKHFILYWDMNEEMYWEVFLKTDKAYFGLLWREEKHEAYQKEKALLEDKINALSISSTHYNDFESETISQLPYLEKISTHSGNQAVRLSGDHRFSPGIVSKCRDLFSGDIIYIKASAFVNIPRKINRNHFSIVFSVEQNNSPYIYKSLNSGNLDLKVGVWNEIELITEIKNIKSPEDIVKVYIYFQGEDAIFVDDASLKIFEKE